MSHLDDLSRLDSLFDEDEDRLPIHHLTPVWSDIIHFDGRAGLCDLCNIGMQEGELVAWVRRPQGLPFPFPVHVGEPVLNDDGSMRTFEIRRIGPGTWVLNPSLHVPEVFHAYIVFCEVPEPAPWEGMKP
jgi:hypothetical protein